MNIKTKIKQIHYELKRRRLAKKIMNNLGRIVIKNNTIFCYVDKRKIERKRRVDFSFPIYYDDIELVRKYDLEKDVCFVVEHANFSKGLHFTTGKNAKVVFRHCLFKKHVEIVDSLGEIVFENNMYYQSEEEFSEPFFSARTNVLKFIDEYLINSGEKSIEHSTFSMMVKANELLFDNTLLYAGDKNATIDITTDELCLSDTTINCPQIYIHADEFTTISSTISADKYAIIENRELNKISIIEAPEIVYNGQDFISEDGQNIVVRNETSELIRKRIELLKTLKNAARTCELIKLQSSKQPVLNIDEETVEKVFKLN